MIHTLTVESNEDTFIIRFPIEQLGEARYRLMLMADKGYFSITKFCEATRQLKEIEDRQMNEMEAFKARLTRAGFNPAFHGNESGWQVTLWHNFPGHQLHRPPSGSAATLKDAIAAAEADLTEMLRAKEKSRA